MTSCKVCLLDGIPEKPLVDKALAAPWVQNTALSAVLTRNGFPVSEASIRRHRSHAEAV